MTRKPDATDYGAITGVETARMLRFTFRAPRRPVDDLIHRLELDDGVAWFTRHLGRGALGRSGPASELLVGGTASLEQLRHLKRDCKLQFKQGKRDGDADAALAGLAGYFLAIAAALHHHGRHIGSQPGAALADVLLDLASALPEPWAELLAAAAPEVAG